MHTNLRQFNIELKISEQMKKFSLILIILFSVVSTINAQERLKLTEKDKSWGYADSKGNMVIPAIYSHALVFNENGVAAVVDKKGWLYINEKGDSLVRPFVFDNGPDYFSEGLARYVEKKKIGFVNQKIEVVIPAKYDFVRPFSEGKAAVCKGCKFRKTGEHTKVVGGKWGYIDTIGKVVIPIKYEDVTDFEDGEARVQLGKWFVIDENGKLQD